MDTSILRPSNTIYCDSFCFIMMTTLHYSLYSAFPVLVSGTRVLESGSGLIIEYSSPIFWNSEGLLAGIIL